MASRGLKRNCASCGTLFYDFDKTPIICPSCKTEFTGIVKIKTRKSRIISADTAKPAGLNEDADEVEAEDGNISLDDLEAEEAGDDEDEDNIDLDDLDDDDLDDADDLDDDEDLDDLDDVEEAEDEHK